MPFQGDVDSYRQYLINKEIAHTIGYQLHEGAARTVVWRR